MQIALPSTATDWLLGTDRKQRNGLRRTLGAAGVYWLAALAQAWAATNGLADPAQARALIVCLTPGLFGFYLLQRCRIDVGSADRSLTMPQMVFALAAMAAGYAINPPLRGMLLMIVALVLVYGAFVLSPRQSRALGALAVLLLGLVMAAMARQSPSTFDPAIERIHFLFAAVVLPLISILAGDLSAMRMRLKSQKTELQAALARIHKLATRDDLTGLINRRHMEELAEMEQRRALRGGGTPCLCLIDIDHFKRFNDRHGHAAGDEALRYFARHAMAAMRDTDLLARWGGEEFLVLLPDTPPEQARTGFQRLRQQLSQSNAIGTPGCITFSAGLTAWAPDEPLRVALARADTALYQAKAGGRDRLVQS